MKAVRAAAGQFEAGGASGACRHRQRSAQGPEDGSGHGWRNVAVDQNRRHMGLVAGQHHATMPATPNAPPTWSATVLLADPTPASP